MLFTLCRFRLVNQERFESQCDGNTNNGGFVNAPPMARLTQMLPPPLWRDGITEAQLLRVLRRRLQPWRLQRRLQGCRTRRKEEGDLVIATFPCKATGRRMRPSSEMRPGGIGRGTKPLRGAFTPTL